MTKFFFYGSNMCIPFLKEMGVKVLGYEKAWIDNFRFIPNVPDDINTKFGYANVVPSMGHKVEGMMVKVDESSIAVLDEYEGYPNDYLKVKRWVHHVKGKDLCWMYFGNMSVTVPECLELPAEQKERIAWGAQFLSEGYQRRLSNFIAD